ncbi:MAG: ATP-dependent helicase [Sphaerochaetaceae bacterium]
MNSSLLSTLNEGQRQSVLTTEGPLLIIAGAGSGKTKMITHRIAYLLESGVQEKEILALTFTNKAGNEMSERIRSLTGKPLKDLLTTTFHSFALRILKKHIHHLGFHHNFTIYDGQDCTAVFKEVLREKEYDIASFDIRTLLAVHSEIKTSRIKSHPLYTPDIASLFETYEQHMKLYNALDFDDLIINTLKLFEEFPHVLEQVRSRFTHIMVDEFQDTSAMQYRLIHHLAQEHRNICIVGDDDQSIYSWRGANYQNIVQFETDFPERKEIFLDRNYRSSNTILSAANQLIVNNSDRKEKTLWTDSDNGETIITLESEDGEDEARTIIEQMRSVSFREQLGWSSFGILVRTNHLLPTLENAFMLEQIPVSVTGGQSFFERKEVKDLIAYMRVFVNLNDDIALLRIINTPRRKIGLATLSAVRHIKDALHISYWEAIAHILEHKEDYPSSRIKALQQFYDLIEEYQSLFFQGGRRKSKVLHSLLERIEYRSFLLCEYPGNENGALWRYSSMETFLKLFSRWENDPENYENNIYEYLQRLMLQMREQQDKEKGEERVSLMTMHSAKGLEFDTVFLAGVEDHIIPHRRTIEENEKALEEERRLFYVAITRAKKRLYISYAKQRKVGSDYMTTSPSRFLEEISADLFSFPTEEEQMSTDEHLERLSSLAAFLESKEA